jgi:hypothetical protein
MTTEIKGAASTAVEKATEAAGAAKARAGEGASSALGTARARTRDEVDRRSTQAGDRALGAAGDIRSVGDELRKQGKDAPARVAERAADQVERAGSYLRDNDADALLADVERFGRERPWAIAAAGFALGIAAARALKASSAERYSRGGVPGGQGSNAVTRPAGGGVLDPARPAGLGGR